MMTTSMFSASDSIEHHLEFWKSHDSVLMHLKFVKFNKIENKYLVFNINGM